MASSSFLSESARWKAVRTRDATADGLFVYAVRTTRIYCRPVCKTRLARQANVTFYDNAEAAERDGYRACKRCKPHIVGLMPDETAVQQIRALIEHTLPAMQTGDIAGLFSLTKLANQAGVSKWHFHRVFKDVTGVTPMEYMRRQNQLDKSSLDVEASGHQLHASIESNLTTTSPEWATEAEDSGKEVNSDDFLISLKTLYACIGQTPDKLMSDESHVSDLQSDGAFDLADFLELNGDMEDIDNDNMSKLELGTSIDGMTGMERDKI